MSRSIVFVLFLLPACAPPEDSDALSSAVSGSQLTHRMPSKSESTLSLHTLPNATCQVRDASQSGALTLFSDDDGIARLHLTHLDASVKKGQLSLDCTDDSGAHDGRTVQVVIDDSATPQAPAKMNHAGKPTLPVLDVPAESLTDADVHARHYPPRPAAADAGYNSWLQLVTGAPTVIAPHTIARPELTHATSGNWSGYVLASSANQPIYAWIYGEWNVPRAYAEGGFYSSDHSSFWVGIDGWGSNDVVQDGTDQNTLTAFWIQTSSYDAWIEWYPLSSQTVSNFPVNPGDDIHTWTWLRDANGNWSNTPTVGWFYMWNATQNVYVYTSINLPAGAHFTGHSAEWVMERPTVNGSVSSLANYNFATLFNASTYDVWGGSHQYGGDNNDLSYNVTMTGNGGAALSTVAPVNPSTMQFTWRGHN
jgi:hypothetical protein